MEPNHDGLAPDIGGFEKGEVVTVEGALPHAGPAVRKLARELGINLSAVQPSGSYRRILREDLLAFVQKSLAQPVDARFAQVATCEPSGIGQRSVASLADGGTAAWMATNFDTSDVTETEAFRTALDSKQAGAGGQATMLAFLIKSVASALKAYPHVHVSLTGRGLVQRHGYKIAFAVETKGGLAVAVIADCDRKGILQIADEARDLTAKARAGTLAAREMAGGCISVTALGLGGSASFTPIIAAPEVAAVGAGREEIRPIWNGKAFEPRLILPLALSWDPRALDGATAARFLSHIADCMHDTRALLC